jgi:hypothetical protein
MHISLIVLPRRRLILQLVLVHIHELAPLSLLRLLLDDLLGLLSIDDRLLLPLLLEFHLAVLGDLRLYHLASFDDLALAGRHRALLGAGATLLVLAVISVFAPLISYPDYWLLCHAEHRHERFILGRRHGEIRRGATMPKTPPQEGRLMHDWLWHRILRLSLTTEPHGRVKLVVLLRDEEILTRYRRVS